MTGPKPVVDVDKLPPTQYLIMEVLASRHRLGETIWPFPPTVGHALGMLHAAGLTEHVGKTAEGYARVRLTPAGRAAVLDPRYLPPPGRAVQAADAMFAFGRALRDAAVRVHMARRGYVSGQTIIVGRDTPRDPATGPVFRVWPDPDVPGGWDGQPEQ